jgi:hypothetical protein
MVKLDPRIIVKNTLDVINKALELDKEFTP